MADDRIIVVFKRPTDCYMVGEQAAFNPSVAETYRQRNFADIVGPVDPVTAAVSEAVEAALPNPPIAAPETVKPNKRKG